MIRNHYQSVSHRHQSPLLASPGCYATVLRSQVAPLHSHSPMRRLHKRTTHPPVALACGARSPFAPALVVARCQAHPCSQVGSRREAAHVCAHLRHKQLGCPPPYPRHTVQQLHHFFPPLSFPLFILFILFILFGQGFLDRLVTPRNGGREAVYLPQQLPQHEALCP